MRNKLTVAAFTATTLSLFSVAVWPTTQTAGIFICFVVFTALCVFNE